MDIKELRLGNYIVSDIFNDRILKVSQIKTNGVSCTYPGQQNTNIPGVRESYFPWNEVSFIKITPYFIVKHCGFTNEEFKGDCYGIQVKTNMHFDFVLVVE